LTKAIDASQKAFRAWESTSIEKRAEIFIRAAELIRGKYRYDVLASTMLGQAKTAHQAEIDAVCELSDFYAFNAQWSLVSGHRQNDFTELFTYLKQIWFTATVNNERGSVVT